MDITTRQLELIEAASRLLTTSGVNGLTIKNLAKEMHFSESAIYRHFSSKEEIIFAMLDYLASTIDTRISNIPQTKNPEENFKNLFQSQFDFFNNNPHFVVAVFSDGLMEESKRINDAILKLMAVMMKHLMPILTDGQHINVFTNAIDNEDLVHVVMGAFKLQMFKWRLLNFEFDLKESGNKMIESVLTLIETKQ